MNPTTPSIPMMNRAKRIKSTNEVNVIYPYRTKHGTWVYDDEDLGVYSEAFVLGSSEVIDHLVGKDTMQFQASISKNPIPGYTARLIKTDAPTNWHLAPDEEDLVEIEETDDAEVFNTGWYQLEGTKMKHWLCGCVLDYFENYPDNIYVLISNLKK